MGIYTVYFSPILVGVVYDDDIRVQLGEIRFIPGQQGQSRRELFHIKEPLVPSSFILQ